MGIWIDYFTGFDGSNPYSSDCCMTVFETIKKIAANSGYDLRASKVHPSGGYILRQEGASCPDGIFQSLDEVIVYLMAQSQKDERC